MDVDVHGNVTGRIPLWKGVAITFETTTSAFS